MSMNFSFSTVPSIVSQWGGARQLGSFLREREEGQSLLIVTDKGLNDAGVLEPAKQSLKQAGFEFIVFDKVVADPPEHVLQECIDLAKSSKVDIVVGLGGGSSMDIAKLVAVLVASKQKLSAIYGINKVQGKRLPLVQMPTTAGTGSEVTNISIITTAQSTKMGVVAPQLYADHVLLDAELTVGLPRLHTAATGIDAMVHAIEAYTSKIKKNPVSDALAREALSLLSSNIITACEDGKNREAREAMLLGATLAGQAFANAPVAAVHALAYPLGGHYHIPHGLSNALMLEPVLQFNAAEAAPLYAELADVVGVGKGEGNQGKSTAFVKFMVDLMNKSGAPRRLRDVDVTQESLPLLARDAMEQQRLLVNNPVAVSEADALALYKAAY